MNLYTLLLDPCLSLTIYSDHRFKPVVLWSPFPVIQTQPSTRSPLTSHPGTFTNSVYDILTSALESTV